MLFRRSRLALPMSMLFALALASCKGAEQVCDPTDPLCGGGGGGPTVANIIVTSPVDTVMAVGRDVLMGAAATDAGGSPVTASFNWNSTNTSVATVSGSGVVSVQTAGTTTIQASASGVTGGIAMRAVDADLDAVTALMTDTFRLALAAALTGTPASTLSGLITTCATQVTGGHVRTLDTCLTAALNVTGTGGNDQALLAVLALFFEQAQRQLNL
jgi:hypothetical protein